MLAILPSARTLLTVALSGLLGGGIAVGVAHRLRDPLPLPAPAPAVPTIVVGQPGGIRLHLDGAVDSVAWKVVGKDFAEVPTKADGADMEVASDPASRLALATYLSAGKPGLATATIPGTTTPPPDPTPGPPPTPKPDPPPAPSIGPGFWAIAVFDFHSLATLDTGQLSVFADRTIRSAVVGLGGEFLRVDIADPEQQSKRSMIAAKASGKLPALVLVRADGSVYGDVLALPSDSQGVIAAIKTALGRR